MNVKVVYATKTKHSKKLAEAIASKLQIKAQNISEHPVLEDVDLLFIAGGIYAGESLPEMISFVKELDNSKVKNVVLITSCTSKTTGQATVRKILNEKNIDVMDEFICQGSFLFFGFGHPNRADIHDAVEFSRRIAGQTHV